MNEDFEVPGINPDAPFTLKLHRGDGMVLLGMNWKAERPPDNFVGFAVEYHEPGEKEYFPVPNRLAFSTADEGTSHPSLEAPIQKFRWIHMPRNADLAGDFSYRVTPMFMDQSDVLSPGPAQTADVQLARDTYPGELNIGFTRGFVSSQAFIERYAAAGSIATLLPAKAADGLTFKPTHPKEQEALEWMGFEARRIILDLLKQAVADTTTQLCAIAYDLNEPEVVDLLEQLGPRLRVIIDNSGEHKPTTSAEHQAADRLSASAGAENVKRQHMGGLQHNKVLIVDGPNLKQVVCGSTNFSWRGFFVQNNNAVALTGEAAVAAFQAAFEQYWKSAAAADFGASAPAVWTSLGLAGVDAQVAFSPHSEQNALLGAVADDIKTATSSVFYALAFLYQTHGALEQAIDTVTNETDVFVYGMSDQADDGIVVQKPDGNLAPVSPGTLGKNAPPPFKPEPTGGAGIRLHHKFVVIDFDKPTARVYLGSYNFSTQADTANGENLLVIRDRRVAVSYMVEAVRLFDHFEFRSKQESQSGAAALVLKKPPRAPGEWPWWHDSYTNPEKIRDRIIFSS